MDLVYNPLGAFLPPEQSKLEEQYREQLRTNFGIEFNNLFTITNMPIKRFADYLHQRGELSDYMDLLVRNFNPQTTESLMCLDMISVGWDGSIFDCDFNQQLGMNIVDTSTSSNDSNANDERRKKKKLSVFDIDSLALGADVAIRMDNHCFGCTAGMGSS